MILQHSQSQTGTILVLLYLLLLGLLLPLPLSPLVALLALGILINLYKPVAGEHAEAGAAGADYIGLLPL